MSDARGRIEGLIAGTPELALVVGEILDRREHGGRMPARLTLTAGDSTVAALERLLSNRFVRRVSSSKVRLDLGSADGTCRRQHGVGLDELFYGALGRAPRDPAAEERDRRAGITAGLDGVFGGCRSDAARQFLAAEIAGVGSGTGETYRLATTRDVDAAVLDAESIARCIDAALINDGPVRMQNFAARVLGHSKAIGVERAQRIGRALIEHHEATRLAVYVASGDLSDRAAQRFALEVNGVYRDEAPLTVHCFGPLAYRKGEQRFDHVAAHARLGEIVPLSLAQLRGAAVVELPVDRIVVIENQAPFLDYVDALCARGDRRELVVFSHGQANWAVIQLLRMVARAAPIVHAGDLDRSGVHILRSIAARALTCVTPLSMDVATHREFRASGIPLADAERERLAALLATDPADAPCHDLLVEILDTGLWIEQEVFARQRLMGGSAHEIPLTSTL